MRWAQRAGGTAVDYGNGIAMDASGNSYVIGKFASTNASFGTVVLTGGGLFVAKYDANGNVGWARRIGTSLGASFHNLLTYNIAADASGNVYVGGTFALSTLSFENITLANGETGNFDLFLAKYDTNGTLAWARTAGGPGGSDNIRLHSLAVDGSGNVYFTGDYFWAAPLGLTNLPPDGTVGFYTAMFDAAGSPVWVRETAVLPPYRPGPCLPLAITLDKAGGYFVAGQFSTPTITFGGTTLTNAGYADLFVVRYDSAGEVLWAKEAASASYDYFIGLAADSAGSCYLTGFCNPAGPVSIGGSVVTNATAFLAKFDPAGNVAWCREPVVFGPEPLLMGRPSRLVADASGNTCLLGQFLTTAAFDSITLTNQALDASGIFEYPSFFLEELDPNGQVIWAKQFAGGNQSSTIPSQDVQAGLAVDRSGNLGITGFMSISNAPFDNFTLSTAGDQDVFVTRIEADLPRLNILVSDPFVLVSWPTNYAGFQLESTETLAACGSWSAITNPVAVVGDQRSVTNNLSDGVRFFRLRKM